MKKFFAITLSLLLLLSLTMAVFADSSTDDPTVESQANIEIKNNEENVPHTYVAYQIFQNWFDVYSDGSKTLVNIQIGADVNETKLKNALKSYTSDDADLSRASPVVLAGIVSAMGKTMDGQEIANILYSCLKDDATGKEFTYNSSTKTYTATYPEETSGYFLIVEKGENVAGKHDAASAYILQSGGSISVTPKSIYPTVDKQVQDESTDAEEGADSDGWGESADHEINEKFKFRLIADLPESSDYAFYETYKVVFTDTMSKGVTFDHIDSVTVDGVTIDANGYTVSGVKAGDAGKTWELTIADLKKITGVDLSDGAKVIVTYTAYLNKDAKVATSSPSSEANVNTVFLQYSNNPKVSGSGNNQLGKTPDDSVFVFTYTANATKYSEKMQNGNELAGAEFKLYRDEECTKEIKLQKIDGKYYPILDQMDGTGDAMVSGTDGKFEIIGLDHGTYYIKESKAPAGFKKLEAPIEVVISASHEENNDGTQAKVTFNSEDMKNSFNIVNKMGASLPTTGGIGTTIFYVVGAVLMFGAAILLVTKKRMNAEK